MPELSPRELAVTFTDTQSYFVSEAGTVRNSVREASFVIG
jgi:hypothetical protein